MHFVVRATVGVALLVATPRPANSCSCGIPFQLVPHHGATNVPTNVGIRLHTDQDLSIVSVTLTDMGTGKSVPIELIAPESVEGYRIQPVGQLSPLTTHKVTFGAGESTFTTGQRLDYDAPDAIKVNEIVIEKMDIGSSCYSDSCSLDTARVAYVAYDTPTDDVAAIVLTWTSDSGLWATLAQPPLLTHTLAESLCGPYFPLPKAREAACARVIAYDLAGNAAVSDEICATQTSCGETIIDEDTGICAVNPSCEIVAAPPTSETFFVQTGGCAAASSGNLGSVFGLLLLACATLRGRVRAFRGTKN